MEKCYLCVKTIYLIKDMLTRKTRYAMMALSILAGQYQKGIVTIGQIADREQIPQRFLEGILLKLKNAGILESTRVKVGGYYLVKDPNEVTLFDIVSIFETSVSLLACVCRENYKSCEFCKDESICPIRKPFAEIYKLTIEVLRRTTLFDLTTEEVLDISNLK